MTIQENGNVSIGDKPSPSEKLEVQGNVKATGRMIDQTGYVTPQGGIIMFTGSYDDLFDGSGLGKAGTRVQGWALCNGQNNTPDLRSRFVVGAVPGSDYGNNTGATGGNNTVQLNINHIPAHTHEYSWPGKWGGGDDWANNKADWGPNAEKRQTGKAGSDNPTPFDVRPPFYAVFYIMKQ
jgi:hypothetical protein